MSAKFTNVSSVPIALAVFLASDSYDHNSDPMTISATTLLKPVRQIILPSRIPQSGSMASLPEMMSNRLGAAVHDAIERSWLHNYRPALQALGLPNSVIDKILINPKKEELTPDCIPIYLEQRLKKQVGKWTVTGKFDFVGEGRVQDFKTASVWSYINQVNSDKQILQGSLYRWLDPVMITQDEMDIHHIFMDWKAAMIKTDPKYPTERFKKQTFTLMSVKETEQYVQRKLALIDEYWDKDEADIPLCSDEDLWRKEPVFKYYKNPNSLSRSTKNFTSLHDANVRLYEDKNVGVVKVAPGHVTACKFCASFPICTQKDQLIASGDLTMG